MAEITKTNALTTRDVDLMFWRWWFGCEGNHSYTRMQAINVGWAFMPALRKLYGENRNEELKRAMLREVMYFNTQGIWGDVCLGVALAMEEDVALNGSMTQDEADVSINGIKTGFMGPFAGVGDTIDWGITKFFLIGIAMGLIQDDGLWYGVFVSIIGFPLITCIEGIVFNRFAYSVGKNALAQLFASGLINKVLTFTAILGLMMMGALGASAVKFKFANATAQGAFDKIAPGMVPLAIIFLTNWLIEKKHWKVPNVAITYTLVCLVLGVIGIV